MSDELKKRWGAWIWLMPVAAPGLYLLSLFPAIILCAWLVEFGVVSERHAGPTLDAVYAPIL